MGEKLRPFKRFKPVENTSDYEMVNHPSHYKDAGGKECIDIMLEKFGTEAVKNFCLLNAFKYIFRGGNKPGSNKEQDWAKAEWYIKKFRDLGGELTDLQKTI